MTWDRWELGQNAIFYDENIRPSHPPAALYPPQVEALRRSMLDFSCLILNHTVGPRGVQVHPTGGEGESQKTDPALTAARKTLHEVSRIHHGGYSEDTWAGFFKDSFFKPLAGRLRPEEDSRRHVRVSRCDYYYDAFTAGANKSWGLFGSSLDDNSDLSSFERSKCPKPDYAFYLPMYHMDATQAIPKVPSPEGRQWNLAQEHSLAGGFSWSNLKELFAFGLRPTPFRVFHKPPQEANLNSYPWLLIEHKKEGVSGSEETVSCQAANGAACAVKLSQISARYAMVLPSHAHIPPMPTVTTIGSKVKVWITYYAEDFHAPCLSRKYSGDVAWKKRKQGTVMRAIWEGDVAKLEDIIMFQAILENTHTWAMRVFKPLMSSYLEQWRHVHCQVGMFATSSALLRQEQTMARCQSIIPIVQDLLDNHSSVEIDDSKHPKVTPVFLGMLVQQIVTSERQVLADEVDRIIKERLDALTPSWQTTVTQRTTLETLHTSQRQKTPENSNNSTAQSPGSVEDGSDDSTWQDSNTTRSPKSAVAGSPHE
ncbi:hypothetical protein BGZ61DRAFT_359296 [Ilyonectria robusta]|uniref:uncharacterized protein n=1 Tax=Ilyonectria robusta TaxID=1079257 RepID=UPI001E8E400F|nr:uncharacterized protein BGZ61DRAFT_359296 [Ilyonectria robusta]KAH8679374.1 hypothetical protein BGZ61DRAFT_359296 [Ilyonectria robusta]